jgi:S1-C subfamily serine protease
MAGLSDTENEALAAATAMANMMGGFGGGGGPGATRVRTSVYVPKHHVKVEVDVGEKLGWKRSKDAGNELKLVSVFKNQQAEALGIQRGWIIVAVDGKEVKTPAELQDVILPAKLEGRKVLFTFDTDPMNNPDFE